MRDELIGRLRHMAALLGVGSWDIPTLLLEAAEALALPEAQAAETSPALLDKPKDDLWNRMSAAAAYETSASKVFAKRAAEPDNGIVGGPRALLDAGELIEQIEIAELEEGERDALKTMNSEYDAAEARIAALTTLVRDAYNEAFAEGMREHTSHRGGKPWSDSIAKKKLAALQPEKRAEEADQ